MNQQPNTLLPAASPPQDQEDDAEVVTSFITDTIMILAIAMIVFIPMAQSRIAGHVKQAAQSRSAAGNKPIEIHVSASDAKVRIDGEVLVLPIAPGSLQDRLQGRSAIVRVHEDQISAKQMEQISNFYFEAGLGSWAFEFRQGALK